MSEIKVAVVGSRNYPRMHEVKRFIDMMDPETVVISGGARGVDTLAVMAANERGLKTVVFYAEWEKYGRGAGLIRNRKLVDACDNLAAFWDGESRGTRNAINLALMAGKRVIVFTPTGVNTYNEVTDGSHQDTEEVL